jgi:sRNA-binding regulator protein Hfq
MSNNDYSKYPMVYKDEINSLNKRVKFLLNEFNKSQNNNMENSFFTENKNKNIVIMLETGNEYQGKLLDIDKFRITVEKDNTPFHIFKHSIIGYYIKE